MRIDVSMFENTKEKLSEIYGSAEASRILMTVMPGITADFRKMLETSAPGETVREVYNLEDGRCAICLEGVRKGTEGMVTRMFAAKK